jgi:serine/threonine protein phosphatase 1
VLNILKNLDGIFLLGNHEEMLIERYKHASNDERSHLMMQASISVNALNWIFEKTQIKFKSENYIFVHAGINKSKKLADQNSRDYIWTREKGDYLELTSKKVIHGHTIVENPEIVGNRININTGCGSNGFLSALVLPEMKFFKSSTSPGDKNDWARILKELELELKELDDFGTLEEIE